MRRALLIILAALAMPLVSASAPEIESRVEAEGSAVLPEGIWQFGADGAVFAISRSAGTAGTYDLVLLESPDLSLPSGIPFGTMTRTDEANNFEATLQLDPAGSLRAGSRRKSRRFIFTLSPEDATLTIQPYSKGHTVNILRWIPYLFRLSVEKTDTRPNGVDKAIRISPPAPEKHIII